MDKAKAIKALYSLTYGLYVVTSFKDGIMGGATVVWVTQSSKKPLAVMLGLMDDSRTGEMIEESKVFAVNILSPDQTGIVKRFASKMEPNEKFEDVAYKIGQTGCPLIESAVAFIECKLVHEIKPGSHKIYLGEVVDANINIEKPPAVYRNGKIFGVAA